jgi:UDP-glucose 4-epimerase
MDSPKENKTILVTGGAGYIGSHTVRELIFKNYSVVVYDNLVYGHREFVPENVEFVKGDLADVRKLNSTFKKYKFDAVVHFAAYTYVGESVKNPSKYFNNNLVSSLHLLDAMIKNNVKKIVFSSSCATYGVPSSNPITEEMPQNPINPYGFSKLVFEKMLDYYDAAYGLKAVCLRYFNAAGAMPDSSLGERHNPETHVIPLMLKGLFDKSFKVFGDDYPSADGSCIRDYIHVCDLADAHAKALEYLFRKNSSEKINLGTGRGISVFELVKIVEKATKKKLQYKIQNRRPGDPSTLIADPAKASLILGWKAQYDIDDIVLHAWNWHRRDNLG